MLTRRSFVQAATAASLAPWIWSPPANAQAASERLTLGFIGVGTMGRSHLGGFLGRDNVEVVAVCDVVKERLDSAVEMVEKRYAERSKSGTYKGVKALADFRELLTLPGLDAVVIATPDHWHAIPCILAARAGKHIYCEKPLTHNVAEGRQIVSEVKKAGVTFQTGSQQRSEFGGHFRKAVEYVFSGRIGKLHTIRIGVGGPARPCDLPTEEIPAGTDWDAWLGPAPERGYNEILCPKGVHKHFPAWRDYREYAGGQIADMGAHHFDIAQLAGAQRLRRLTLPNVPITDAAMASVVQMPALESLTINRCEDLTERGIRQLAQSSSLKSLEVSDSHISDDTIRLLRRRLERVTVVSAGGTVQY